MKRVPAALALGLLPLVIAAGPASRETQEQACRENNRGVALLEQFRAAQAADAFRKALALDRGLALARRNLPIALLYVPDLTAAEQEARRLLAADPEAAQAWYVLGLALKGQSRGAEAAECFRHVLGVDPSDVGASVNLGQLLVQEQKYADAIGLFRTALGVEPHNGTALYNLGLALTRAGQAEEGRRTLESFQALRNAGYGTFVGANYSEQGRYALAQASTGAEPELVDVATPQTRFVDVSSDWLPTHSPTSGASEGRVTLFDFDGDGRLDAFEVGAAGQHLYRNEGGRFDDVTARVGLDAVLAGTGAVAGDVDNDGRPDLLVLRAHGVTLYRNDAERGFLDVTKASGIPQAPAASAALADFDHDGDLDVLLAGPDGADRLLQNNGSAVFKDVAGEAGIGAAARVLAAVPTDYDNGRDIDLLEAVEDGSVRLFKNLRDGRFKDVAAEVGLGGAARLRSLAVADVNKDGFSDAFFGADGGDLLALSDGKGGFRLEPAPWGSAGTSAALFIDYDNDGLLDLVMLTPTGLRLVRNLGGRWQDVTAAAFGAQTPAAVALAAGDVDGDGATDLVLRTPNGELRLWRNQGTRNASVAVRLAGRVSNRSGLGAKVEVRAGSLAQKLETYATTPTTAPADLLFGLGPRAAPDAVRVLWPSGILQTELTAEAPGAPRVSRLELKELDRKPSSCPYLYAWDGRRFAFVTDFMGGGEMGYFEEPGVFNQPNPVEQVRLTDTQLRPRAGRLELRVTNELEEALFLDRLSLLAVTHPAGTEVYPYEGMTSPPKESRLYTVSDLHLPVGARDDHGHDVLERIARVDRRYPDDFALDAVRGFAELHALTLDLGHVPDQAVLLLTGWTDYAFSSDNVAARQAGLATRPPSLDVQDAAGRWVTAIDQVGVPVGRPQTVVTDLTGIWRSASRIVRITTNMRVYWDQIRVARVVDAPLTTARLPLQRAELRERGFSAETSPDGREPFGYDYARVSRSSPWKAFPGRYTREGDVRELLSEADDVFVVSRPGDEIALDFDARALAELPADRRRTYLLASDGFSKEMDIHSATPDAIGPWPFHGMTRYPYAAPQAFPMTEAKLRLIERYNTRVVSRPVPALLAAAKPGQQ